MIRIGIWNVEYHPYGTTAWWAGDSALVSQKRYKFTGMERDEETGLQCHGVRYYATWLGRWTSADPVGLGDGVNRYCYCHAHPIAGIDPGGMEDAPAPPITPALTPSPSEGTSETGVTVQGLRDGKPESLSTTQHADLRVGRAGARRLTRNSEFEADTAIFTDTRTGALVFLPAAVLGPHMTIDDSGTQQELDEVLSLANSPQLFLATLEEVAGSTPDASGRVTVTNRANKGDVPGEPPPTLIFDRASAVASLALLKDRGITAENLAMLGVLHYHPEADQAKFPANDYYVPSPEDIQATASGAQKYGTFVLGTGGTNVDIVDLMYSDGALQAAVVKQPTRMEMFQASQVFSHRDDAYATLRAGFNVKAYRTDGRTLALAPY